MVYKVAILTISDKGSQGLREDKSGPLIRAMCENAGYSVVLQEIIPDEVDIIKERLISIADGKSAHLILTTGGTGFAPRDCTPEATMAVCEKNAPGIAEAIRAYSMTVTKRAMLGRGASVIRKESLIINLPGSPKAVEESLEYILPELDHGLGVLLQQEKECGRK